MYIEAYAEVFIRMYVFAERLKERLYSVEQQLSSAIARGNEIQVRICIYIYICSYGFDICYTAYLIFCYTFPKLATQFTIKTESRADFLEILSSNHFEVGSLKNHHHRHDVMYLIYVTQLATALARSNEYTCIHICMHIHMYIYICMYIYIYTCVYV